MMVIEQAPEFEKMKAAAGFLELARRGRVE